MENFECSICYKKFDNPVECIKCNNNFCKKHIDEFRNCCPLCKHNPFQYRENIWLSRAVSNIDYSYKCTECGYEGDQSSFWSHLIEDHKKEIMNHFNEYKNHSRKDNDDNKENPLKKDNNNNENRGIKEITISTIPISESYSISEQNEVQNNNNNNKEQKIDNYNLFNNNFNIYNNNNNNNYNNNNFIGNNNFNNNNNFIGNYDSNINVNHYPIDNFNSQQIKRKKNMSKKKEDVKLQNTHRNFQLKNYNQQANNQNIENNKYKKIPNTDREIILYCGKKNELIACDCCPDHICKPGNCLCVNCMRKNIKKFNFREGELINKKGKIAKLFKGNYFCGEKYDKSFINVSGIKFDRSGTCEFPYDSCDNCKILNKFKNLYYDYN